VHDSDEIIGFFGSDSEKPEELNGEVEIWLGDEKHVIERSTMIFVPAGLVHCPLVLNRGGQAHLPLHYREQWASTSWSDRTRRAERPGALARRRHRLSCIPIASRRRGVILQQRAPSGFLEDSRAVDFPGQTGIE